MGYQQLAATARKHAEKMQGLGPTGKNIARTIFALIKEIRQQRRRLSRALQRAEAAERFIAAHGLQYERPQPTTDSNDD